LAASRVIADRAAHELHDRAFTQMRGPIDDFDILFRYTNDPAIGAA